MPSARPPGRPCLGVEGDPPCRKRVKTGSRCAQCKRRHESKRERKKAAVRQATGQRTGSTRESRRVRYQVLTRDGFRCTARLPDGRRCPQVLNLHDDHVVPRSKGGSDALSNRTTLCQAHNLAKGATTWERGTDGLYGPKS